MVRLWILLLLTPCLGMAQPSLLNEAIFAYEEGDYPQTIQTLAALIEADGAVPAHLLPRAHFYLAQAYWQAYQQPELSRNYPEALLRAYNHLTAAERLDLTGRYSEMSKPAFRLLMPAMYDAGCQVYNRGDYALAVRYFNRIHQLQGGRHDVLLARGYAQWQLGDTNQAVNSWQRAIDRAPLKVRESDPDESLVRAYAMIVHARSSWGQVSAARTLLAEAYRRFPRHPLLREAETALYLNHNTLRQKGKEHFANELRLHPKDKALQLSYARFLYYQGDTTEAVFRFFKYLENNPDDPAANRFLSAHYIHMAKAIIDQPLSQSQFPDANARQNAIIENLLEALPYLNHLHKLEPEEKFWAEQLVAVTEYLQLPQAKGFRKELRKYR
jgi:tetratricopeptide (TPR) repeat protein